MGAQVRLPVCRRVTLLATCPGQIGLVHGVWSVGRTGTANTCSTSGTKRSSALLRLIRARGTPPVPGTRSARVDSHRRRPSRSPPEPGQEHREAVREAVRWLPSQWPTWSSWSRWSVCLWPSRPPPPPPRVRRAPRPAPQPATADPLLQHAVDLRRPTRDVYNGPLNAGQRGAWGQQRDGRHHACCVQLQRGSDADGSVASAGALRRHRDCGRHL